VEASGRDMEVFGRLKLSRHEILILSDFLTYVAIFNYSTTPIFPMASRKEWLQGTLYRAKTGAILPDTGTKKAAYEGNTRLLV